MAAFDVYGSPTLTVVELRDRVAAVCGLVLEEHDSLYWGVYHLFESPNGEETVGVYDNVRGNDPEEDPPFDEYPEAVSVVTVTTGRPEEFARSFAGIEDLHLLRHSELDPAPLPPPTTFRDMWGSPALTPEQVRDRLAAALGVAFAVRTMSARGGRFHVVTGPDGEQVTLTDNRVVIGVGGTVYDPDAAVITVVEVVGPLAAADAIRGRLAGAGLVLVRHQW